MKSMYEQYFEEPKYRPSFIAEPRVAAGLLGRKTGRGWYEYTPDMKIPPEPAAPTKKPAAVWAVAELKEMLSVRTESKPGPDCICLVAPLGRDCTAAALEQGLDPARTVAVDPLFGFTKRRTLMVNPLTTRQTRDAAHALLAADGVPVSVINDSPGFVAQRVVAHIVNVGCDIAQMRIASPQDLDRAVMLGLGYPKGPLGMGDAVGSRKILSVLQSMYELYQEPRYRPSPWLRRRALAGASLLTPEN
jgi:3-hydroxybutyryl-CoA dehydrogenase